MNMLPGNCICFDMGLVLHDKFPFQYFQARFTMRKDISRYIWHARDDLAKYVVTLPSRIGIAPTFYNTSIAIVIILLVLS